MGDSVTFSNGSPSKLYAWPQYVLGDSRDLEALTTRLWALLNDKIRQRKFSYRLGSYRDFDTYERDFIERAFAQYDQDA